MKSGAFLFKYFFTLIAVFTHLASHAEPESDRWLERAQRGSRPIEKYLESLEQYSKNLPHVPVLTTINEQVELAVVRASRYVASGSCRSCKVVIAEIDQRMREYHILIAKTYRTDAQNLRAVTAKASQATAELILSSTFERFHVLMLNSKSMAEVVRHDPYGRFLYSLIQNLMQQTLWQQTLHSHERIAAAVFNSPYTEIQCGFLRSVKIEERDIPWLLAVAGDAQYKSLRPCLIGHVLKGLSARGQMAVAERIWSVSSPKDQQLLLNQFRHTFSERPTITDEDELLLIWMLKQNHSGLKDIVLNQMGKKGLEKFPGLVAQFFTTPGPTTQKAAEDFDNPFLVMRMGGWLCQKELKPVVSRIIKQASNVTLAALAREVLSHRPCFEDVKLLEQFLEMSDHMTQNSFVTHLLPNLENPTPLVDRLFSRLNWQEPRTRDIFIAVLHHPQAGLWKDLAVRELHRMAKERPQDLEYVLQQIATLQRLHEPLEKFKLKAIPLVINDDEANALKCEQILSGR